MKKIKLSTFLGAILLIIMVCTNTKQGVLTINVEGKTSNFYEKNFQAFALEDSMTILTWTDLSNEVFKAKLKLGEFQITNSSGKEFIPKYKKFKEKNLGSEIK
ncbi:hypothetical protein GW932_00185 [archaeon]|nr:hypothetical protein [archaeon]